MAIDYCVAHVGKFKMWSVEAMEKHLNRTAQQQGSKTNYDINPELTKYNVNLMDRQEKFNEFRFKEKYKDVTSHLDSKPRKDAVAFFSVVVSASPEYFKGKTIDQIENYFEAAKDFLMDFYGPENCVGAYVHFDEEGNRNREASPHMHFVVAPIKDNKLCCKKIITRSSLTKLQDDLPRYLQSRGYDVKRGVVNSPRYHVDTKNWKREELIKEATQEELMKALQVDVQQEKKFFGKSDNVVLSRNDYETIKKIADQSVAMIENNADIVRRRNEMQVLQKEMDEQKKEIVRRMKEQQKIAAQLTADQQRLVDRERAVENYKKILEAQDKDIALQKLADDLERQKQQLKQEQIKFDKKIIERVQSVRDVAKKLVLEEIKKEGEQGKYSKEALKVLKEKYPETFDEVIKVAGKKLRDGINSKVQKIIEQDLLPPK